MCQLCVRFSISRQNNKKSSYISVENSFAITYAKIDKEPTENDQVDRICNSAMSDHALCSYFYWVITVDIY